MKVRKKVKGGISAYVMIMFGMIVILYLMGFTNAWASYSDRSIANEEGGDSISDPGAVNPSIGDMMIMGIRGLFTSEGGDVNWLTAIGAGIISLAGLYLASKVGGQYAFAYIIPIVFIVLFSNIFLFPIEPVSGQMHWVGGTVPLDIILIVFFNLWLILAIIEFVRGPT